MKFIIVVISRCCVSIQKQVVPDADRRKKKVVTEHVRRGAVLGGLVG